MGYIGAKAYPGIVCKISLGGRATRRLSLLHSVSLTEYFLNCAAIDAAGRAIYFGTSTQAARRVVKVAMGDGGAAPHARRHGHHGKRRKGTPQRLHGRREWICIFHNNLRGSPGHKSTAYGAA